MTERRAWHRGLWQRIDRAAFSAGVMRGLCVMGLLLAMLAIFRLAACGTQGGL